MALHKIVNGIKIDCTPEEEVSIRAEWAANDAEKAQKDAEQAAKKTKHDSDRAKAVTKLEALGFTDDEISALTS